MADRPEHRYVPILKGKKGEFDALQGLAAADKERITPLVEIFTVPWDWDTDAPAKRLEDHLDSAAQQLAGGWGADHPLWLDTLWLDPEASAGGKDALEYLFDRCRGALAAIPVGGPGRPPGHVASVAAVHAADQRGAVLRLDPDDLGDPSGLASAVAGWLAAVGVAPDEVDLVVDFSAIAQAHAPSIQIAAGAIIPTLPRLLEWRSVTLASGCFPADLSAVKRQSVEHLPRCDWTLWRNVAAGTLPRVPAFGDYAISHPVLFDPDPRMIRPSATIRYSAADAWVIVKGRWAQRYGFQQFNQASATLVTQPEWCASAHCVGCAFIDACAAGGPTGNLTTWRKVGTVHHLTLTAAQLASLP